MKKAVKISLIVLVVVLLVLNVVLNLFSLPYGQPIQVGCTLIGCPCENIVGERPCNSCQGASGPMLITGILNAYKTCSGREIITCQEGVNVDRRIDWDCKYSWNVLGLFP